MADDAHDDNKKVEEALPNPAENPRNQRFNQIAAEENQLKKDGIEVVDVADEDHDKTTEINDETETRTERVETSAPPKFKIKVNGVEQEVTQEEMTRLAEESAGAQAKFQEAARIKREAEELRAQQTRKDAETAVDDDDRALARALQMGSEEEAAAVIRKIKSRPSEPADVDRRIDQRMELRTSAEWFKTEYPEIVQDPNLLALALAEDENLVKAGDSRPYRSRYQQIGDSLRKWRDGLKAPASTQEKLERKATLKVVPTATVRNAPPKEDDDEGQSNAEFIAAEAKRRGQQFVR